MKKLFPKSILNLPWKNLRLFPCIQSPEKREQYPPHCNLLSGRHRERWGPSSVSFSLLFFFFNLFIFFLSRLNNSSSLSHSLYILFSSPCTNFVALLWMLSSNSISFLWWNENLKGKIFFPYYSIFLFYSSLKHTPCQQFLDQKSLQTFAMFK